MDRQLSAVQEERGPRKGTTKLSESSSSEYPLVQSQDQRQSYRRESNSTVFASHQSPERKGISVFSSRKNIKSGFTNHKGLQLRKTTSLNANSNATMNPPISINPTLVETQNMVWPMTTNGIALNFSQPVLYWEQINGVQGWILNSTYYVKCLNVFHVALLLILIHFLHTFIFVGNALLNLLILTVKHARSHPPFAFLPKKVQDFILASVWSQLLQLHLCVWGMPGNSFTTSELNLISDTDM